MITPDLLSMLWCPTCQNGPLSPVEEPKESTIRAEGWLRCARCDATYPIRLGFPALFPREGLNAPEWKLWSDHLEKFQARREARLQEPERPINRLAQKSQPQPSFANFIGISDGVVLDVGCGPGKFRHYLDTDRVRYVGLDPLALPEVSDFPFVQGLAEYLPFKAGSFTDVVVLAALDHFRDLDRFLAESRRVLREGGRLHILQSVHEVRGLTSAIRVLAHKVKDALEERSSPGRGHDIPKHLTEFTNQTLLQRINTSFDTVGTEKYSATWYSPEKLFLSFSARA